VILSERVLFVHVPKTGGMAVTRYLLGVLPRPVWYTHPDRDPALDAGVIQLPGIRHESLAEAWALAARQGVDPARLPLVLGVVRNPYALEVSRFAYLQKGHAWDAGPNQELALAGDFTAFAAESSHHAGRERPIESYFEIDGQTPRNMAILRQETLHDDLPKALREAGIAVSPDAVIAHDNESRHGPWLAYYTRAAVEAVNDRYRWVFDRGLYERLDPAALPECRETPFDGVRIATHGPIRQAGPITGLWHDGWAERRVSLPLVADADLASLVVRGHAPHAFPGGLHLTITAGDDVTREAVAGTEPFAIAAAGICRSGGRVRLVIEASASFCPRDEGSGPDTRHLAYVLSRIDAVEAAP
jgi:hypothetical protein